VSNQKYIGMKKPAFVISAFLLVLISCQNQQTKEEFEKLKAKTMLEEQNIKLIEKLFEEININRNLEVYDELCDPQYSFYSPSLSPDPLSLGEVKVYAEMILKAFPDVNYTLKKIFADGQHVIVWNVFNGTHRGDFQGIPATGNQIKVSSILLFLIKDGKIIEEREEYDMLGAMMQMGMELRAPE
jgi:steroid delta-isomerase-like uncharacterized protein